MKNIWILSLFVGLMFAGCNERSEDLPDEDYNALFPNKGKIDKPDTDYTNMTPMVCDPKENEMNFQYPGVNIKKNVRDYTVTLKYQFTETKANNMGGDSRSQFDLKYVTKDKTLAVLRSYSEDGKPADIENGKEYEVKFKVKSGYPLYLSVYGAGYDLFKMKATIQAKSDDGIVVSPVIKYETSFYADGFTEMTPYCEKIILP